MDVFTRISIIVYDLVEMDGVLVDDVIRLVKKEKLLVCLADVKDCNYRFGHSRM